MMQTLVTPAERVFNAFMLHCSANMIRARVYRSGGKYLEYPEAVCELCKDASGSSDEIIEFGVQKAIAWFAKNEGCSIDYARQWLIGQTDAFYQDMIKKCQSEREVHLCIQSIEDLLLKPLWRRRGG